MIINSLVGLLMVTSTGRASPRFACWVDTQLTALGDLFARDGRRLTPEQSAMAREIFKAASAPSYAGGDDTFALWISTRSLRGNSLLIASIARVLWPHKPHVHHQLHAFTGAPENQRRFNRLGAILILDDVGDLPGLFEAYRLRNHLGRVVITERDFAAVIVIDAQNLMGRHGVQPPAPFRRLDLTGVIDDCARRLRTDHPGRT